MELFTILVILLIGIIVLVVIGILLQFDIIPMMLNADQREMVLIDAATFRESPILENPKPNGPNYIFKILTEDGEKITQIPARYIGHNNKLIPHQLRKGRDVWIYADPTYCESVWSEMAGTKDADSRHYLQTQLDMTRELLAHNQLGRSELHKVDTNFIRRIKDIIMAKSEDDQKNKQQGNR